jgi:hypothetical protein
MYGGGPLDLVLVLLAVVGLFIWANYMGRKASRR